MRGVDVLVVLESESTTVGIDGGEIASMTAAIASNDYYIRVLSYTVVS